MRKSPWLFAGALALLAGTVIAAEINDLDTSDANNTARFPENMAPSAVNDGARALEGIIARWHEDTNCNKASTGSSNAYVFAANQTLSSYYDGLTICFDANFANTGAATLNVDSLGAKDIKKNNDLDLESGDIESGQKVFVVYDGTSFQLLSIPAVVTPATNTVTNATIADNAVGLAEMASGTDGNLITYDASGDPAAVATGTSGQVLTSNGAGAAPTFQAINAAFETELFHATEEQTQNTDGGTFTSGAWQTRALNQVKTNEITSASLSANVISLPAGTYYAEFIAIGNKVDLHQTRLRDTTNNTTLVTGLVAQAGSAIAIGNPSHGAGRFTLSGTANVELQHQCSTTRATDGFGKAANFTTEVYSSIRIWKVS